MKYISRFMISYMIKTYFKNKKNNQAKMKIFYVENNGSNTYKLRQTFC